MLGFAKLQALPTAASLFQDARNNLIFRERETRIEPVLCRPLTGLSTASACAAAAETSRRAVARIEALGDAAPNIAAWAGPFENTCFCGAHFIAAKG